jgi:methionyl-tRNA formyltransferase
MERRKKKEFEDNFRLYLLGQKGLASLQAAIETNLERISDVVIGVDAGTLTDHFEEITRTCKNFGISWFLRGSEPTGEHEIALAIGWRWILEEKCNLTLVFHDSLLPRYRGFNPLVSALICGDSKIGATVVTAINGEPFDSGPIIMAQSLDVTYPLKIAEATNLMATIYVELIKKSFRLSAVELRNLQRPQDDSSASYSLWRDSLDYWIDWAEDSRTLARFIDATGYPYQGACTMLNGRLIRVTAGIAMPEVEIINRTPGKVLFVANNSPSVVCGSGLLEVTKGHFQDSGVSILPLKKFRSRFHS